MQCANPKPWRGMRAGVQVETMRKELRALKPVLQKTVAETEKLMEQVSCALKGQPSPPSHGQCSAKDGGRDGEAH